MVKSKWYGRLNGSGVEFGEKRFRHFALQSVRLCGCEFSKKKIRVKVKLRLLNKNGSKEKESFNCCTHITAIIIEYANDLKNIRKR